MINKQSRVWCPVLYPCDNEKHKRALDIAQFLDNTIIMDHDEVLDPETNEVLTKKHTHLLIWFNQPYWLSTLLKDLDLDEEDAHLFVNLKQITHDGKSRKFKNKEDYVIYLTHINESDKDVHDPSEFYGSSRDYAIKVCSKIAKTNYDLYIELTNCIHYIMDNYVDCRSWYLYQWADAIIERGCGEALNKHWSKFRDIVKDYTFY